MPRMAQLILALLLGLALLTWAASSVVQTTARGWFERDVSSRARLVLVGARQSLADGWNGDPKDLQKQLIALARDERVMGAAVCDVNFKPLTSTPGFPDDFNCWTVGARVRAADPGGNTTGPDDFNCWTVGARVRAADPGGNTTGILQEWNSVATLPTGRVHISVMPIWKGQEVGFAILLHDLSFIERREADARIFLF